MATANASAISLKGSTELVSEFFYYGVNSVLYQRGIYPPEEFEQTKKYGIPLLVSKEKGVKIFIDNVLSQSNEWMMRNEIQRLVIVIMDVKSEEVKERWTFDIETDREAAKRGGDKPDSVIRQEIAGIIKQITASVSYLPLLETQCKFDILVHTRKDAATPQAWEESDPRLIRNAELVQLRHFSTSIHKVEASVAYTVDA